MANYDANFPADDEYLIDFPAKQRNQQEALKDSAIVNAGKLQGKVSGNNSDNIPINNGTVNTNLNADMLDGKHANELSLVGHIHNDATTSEAGFMSATDKTKLNGIATGAEVNQNAFANVKVGTSTIQADSKTDTLELVAGSNVTLTPDTTNDKVTITSKDTVTTVTTSGSGNAVTSITANNGALTVTKGTTFLTSHQDISGKANLSGATFTGNIGVNLSSGEANITAKGLAGTIYLYATGSNTGNRGIYGLNASGTGQNILQVAQNGTVTIPNLSGYSASNHTHSYVPTTRKVNNKALSSDITLTASDVGASASGHTHSYLSSISSALSLAGNGYCKFVNGLVVQWGKATTTGVEQTVTFPVAFPNECYTVIANMGNTTVSGFEHNVYPKSWTKTNFVVYTRNTSSGGFTWVAFGK